MQTVIVEDTRQKIGHHDNVSAFCSERGIRLIRLALRYGDYAALPVPEDIDPWGVPDWLDEIRPQIQKRTTNIRVDTKFGLSEVYSNLVHDHDRVAAECDGAYESGLRLIFLVEESGIKSVDDVHKWANPQIARYKMWKRGYENGRYCGTKIKKAPIESDRLQKMMKTFAEHHHCEWKFCDKAHTGERLMEILTDGNW